MAAERQKEHTGFSERRILFGLALFCAILYFSGIGQMAVTDPVEVNYTETAKEMLAAGDWLSPRIYGQYWYDKPVFFYWELMAAFKLFGITDFAARFFPALFATIGVYMTYFSASISIMPKQVRRRQLFWGRLSNIGISVMRSLRT